MKVRSAAMEESISGLGHRLRQSGPLARPGLP